MTQKQLPNHIEEYIKDTSKDADFITLFDADKTDVDLKTDVSFQELVLVNNLIFTNKFLIDCGIDDIYTDFIDQYLRLKVSKDRLSRGEFVNINKKDHFEDGLNRFNSFTNLSKVKE